MRSTASADPLVRAFLRHPGAAGLLEPGTRVLVALSGGLDSVVLLHLLRFHAEPLGLQLTAAHFDHGMRADSGRDAAWVRGLCRAWRVPLQLGTAPAPLRGETQARAARYRFLEAAADVAGAAVVLTGHQLDDQAETVLFRLARGTGLRGLAGIPARRGRLLRPLLPFTRGELLAYARRARVRWREDATNRSPAFARNRIRTQLLPLLEARWPGATRRLGALAERAAEVEAMWRGLLPRLVQDATEMKGPQGFRLARGVLLEYHPATRARVLRYLLRSLGSGSGRAGTRAALAFIRSGGSGAGIDLEGGFRVEREFDHILLCRPAVPGTGADDRPIRIRDREPGRDSGRVRGRPFRAHWGTETGGDGATATFDPDALAFPLLLRRWAAGDRIALAYGTKKVKKLLQERRLGRSARAGVLVLVEQAGGERVLWVVDHARTASVPERGGHSWQITVEHGESG